MYGNFFSFLIGINVIWLVHKASVGRWYVAVWTIQKNLQRGRFQWKRKRVSGKNLSTWHATVFTMQCAFYEFILCRSFFPMFVLFSSSPLRLVNELTLHILIDSISAIWISFATFALCVSLIKPSVSTYLIAFLLSFLFFHFFIDFRIGFQTWRQSQQHL